MPKRERSGAVSMPARVVAPMSVNFGRFEPHAARVRALVDDDVEPEVLHRGVEVFLDGRREAVDFVDEENVAALRASVSRPARSPAFSIVGPLVLLMFTPIGLARM